MHTKSDNTDILKGSETNNIIKELFKSIVEKYQKGLEESMRGSEFTLDSVNFLYYHLYRISLKRGGSYIDSPEWLKNKKAKINPENSDYNCLQYVLNVALNYQNIKKDPHKISKIKPFIDQCNLKRIDFPSHSNDWKNLNKKIRQLLLISYLYHTILKK